MRSFVFLICLLGALTADAAKPNVLFIAVDDLRPELGIYGSRAITPNIDRLAKSGVVFRRAYCNQAVCGASRVSLMTGLYPEFTQERTYHVRGWRKRWSKVVTLNQHFKANGYTTVGLGKVYHNTNGPGADRKNWTRWIGVQGQEYANAASLAAAKRNSGPGKKNKKKRKRGPATESSKGGDDVHFDGQRARVGAEQIRQLASAGQPFFLAIGFTKPHLPFVAPRKYWDLYSRRQFKLPGNAGVPPGYPSYARNRRAGELRSYSDIPNNGLPESFPSNLNRRLLHGYHACVSYTDRNVGVLLDALAKSPAANNTIVVLWADHGWKLGDHSSWCKHTNFECDTRVPLLVRTPGGKAHQSSALVELIDLYPTLCELCGIGRPRHIQGRSFAAIIQMQRDKHRFSVYSSYPHGRGMGKGRVVGHSIRTKRYRYTEWWNKKDKRVKAILTDIERDPGETTVVRNRKVQNELSRVLQKRVRAARRNRESS